MSAAAAAGWAVVAPVVGALLVVLLGRRPNLREAATLLSGAAVFGLVVAAVLPAVAAGERPRLELAEVVPGLVLAFEVEPLGMVFALVASFLWIVTSLYSIGYLRGHGERHQTRFYACFALAITGALGVAFAANVFTLFLFYEFITVVTYPLVTHHGTAEAKRSGRIYIGVLMGTSIAFLLLATVWTYVLAGTTDFTPGGILAGKAAPSTLALLLALYAFGTGKAALMPFHRWLPAAMVAPTPVSALLHAVAVVKAGVFTVAKVIVYIFGVEELAASGAGGWLTWVAAFTLVAAGGVAIYQDNLKLRLAYSTISQLAYIVLGVALAQPWSVVGAGMNIVMHAFGKITLFFCAGAIYVGVHKSLVSELDGLGRRMPFTLGAFLVGSLSIIALPPAGGLWGKWLLATGAASSGAASSGAMLAIYMVSSLLAIGYLMPVVARAFFAPAKDEDEDQDQDAAAAPTARRRFDEAPFLCVAPPVLTAAGCVALFVLAEPLRRFLAAIVGGAG